MRADTNSPIGSTSNPRASGHTIETARDKNVVFRHTFACGTLACLVADLAEGLQSKPAPGCAGDERGCGHKKRRGELVNPPRRGACRRQWRRAAMPYRKLMRHPGGYPLPRSETRPQFVSIGSIRSGGLWAIASVREATVTRQGRREGEWSRSKAGEVLSEDGC
jgi:hypothetical protein